MPRDIWARWLNYPWSRGPDQIAGPRGIASLRHGESGGGCRASTAPLSNLRATVAGFTGNDWGISVTEQIINAAISAAAGIFFAILFGMCRTAGADLWAAVVLALAGVACLLMTANAYAKRRS